MKKIANVEFLLPTEEENKVLDFLDSAYLQVSEMTASERGFLNALILRSKPKKLVEIGVSAGSSSVVILNAVKDIPEAKLYSIDLYDNWYRDKSKKTGFIADNYPLLKTRWTLFTGALALHFMDEIAHAGGGGGDFCFIDTAHVNPGEILDFLMILPFLDENAVVVFHDTALQTIRSLSPEENHMAESSITNNLLMSAVAGGKILQGNFKSTDKLAFPNIGGIKICKNTKENVFGIFNLLLLTWHYLLSEKQEQEIVSFFEKYYDEYYIDYLRKVFLYQKRIAPAVHKTLFRIVNVAYRTARKIGVIK